jgi:hypothetical protein
LSASEERKERSARFIDAKSGNMFALGVLAACPESDCAE